MLLSKVVDVCCFYGGVLAENLRHFDLYQLWRQNTCEPLEGSLPSR